MKMIIATLLLVSSFAVQAFPRTKVVRHVSTLAMHGVVTYDKLCVNGNVIQTKQPQKICVKWKRVRRNGDNERTCVKTEMQIISRNLDYMKEVCADRVRRRSDRHDCRRTVKVPARISTEYRVRTVEYKWQGSRSDGGWSFPGKTLSVEHHEVPACL